VGRYISSVAAISAISHQLSSIIDLPAHHQLAAATCRVSVGHLASTLASSISSSSLICLFRLSTSFDGLTLPTR
jgi:hypothetical protein